MDEAKKTIRSEALARRNALAIAERAARSSAICDELERTLAAAWVNTRHDVAPLIAVYASLGSEVSLEPFIEAATRRGWDLCFPCMVHDAASPGRDVVAPHEATPVENATGAHAADASRPRSHMTFVRLPLAREDFPAAAFLENPLLVCAPDGPELAFCKPVAAESIDAVIVPLVGFDDDRRRLGYGGGNYDRFLPQVRKDALVIGVAFEEQRCSALPCEKHDVPLPRLIIG